ncbi:MAG TPA: MATE family efflux transporter [Steroidobacteraceae bacterium]
MIDKLSMAPATPVNQLLHGPILRTLVRLAIPTVVVLMMTTVLSVAETYFVSSLGTAAIAGASLVIPVQMLMTMVSNGAIGGGVASAIARALGANRRDEAESLAFHALVIGLGFGAVFTGVVMAFGPALYRALGGSGEALHQALRYSNILFGASVLFCVLTLLQAALRGSGNVRVPAAIVLSSVVICFFLSPALILGWLGLPRLGVAGAGLAQVLCNAGAVVFIVLYMRSARSNLRLRRHPLRLQPLRTILGVGALSAIGAVQANLSIVAITAAAGSFGVAAIAGYGIASRLEFLMIPIFFGFGSAALTIIGANVGAGQIARARRVALINACIVAAGAEALGILIAFFPRAWLGLFTSDPTVLAIGTQYLLRVGPVYGVIAIGTELYFAGQGAGRVGGPVLAGTARFAIAAAGASLVVFRHGSLVHAFDFVTVAAFAFAIISAQSFRVSSWTSARTRPTSSPTHRASLS